jgi:hypothetical protein
VLLDQQLRQVLQPRALAVYLEGADGWLRLERGVAPPHLQALPAALPVLQELARRGQPWEVPPGAALDGLEALAPECLTPVLGRTGRLAALLALAERLSEESYSREDRRLHSSVAGQAGIALENIRLAERMVERLEVERRASYEMEIAQQVQSRLFPQVMPLLRTLEYAGGCRQARAVGGDYFDFLDLAPGRVALVLADVAGKGISAALLMATLQASLRSQHAAMGDPARVLCAVNRVFYPSAAPNRLPPSSTASTTTPRAGCATRIAGTTRPRCCVPTAGWNGCTPPPLCSVCSRSSNARWPRSRWSQGTCCWSSPTAHPRPGATKARSTARSGSSRPRCPIAAVPCRR